MNNTNALKLCIPFSAFGASDCTFTLGDTVVTKERDDCKYILLKRLTSFRVTQIYALPII